MERYKDLYKWMIIPMVIMQLGIFQDYWGDFSENAWAVHIHYWTGTAWYFFLIIQPYFISRGQFARHRTNGIIGMFLAGGVCVTALSMMHRDIVSSQRSLAEPEKFGAFEPWFFFGVVVVELVMMTAFGFAVIMSVLRRERVEDHAWWLTSTVFLIMMPALGRGLGNVYIGLGFTMWQVMLPLMLTQVIILSLLFFWAWKYGMLRHPATYLAAAVNFFIFLLEPIGRSELVQQVLAAAIKG